MIWLLIIPLLFILLLLVILWLPVELEVDTQLDIYQVRWRGVFALWAIPTEERWRWFFQVFYWQREWVPGKQKQGPKQVRKVEKTKSIKSAGRISFSVKKIRPILNSLSKVIRFQRLRVNWDTGDFLLNAWLYPAFLAASQHDRQLSINFWGKQDLAFLLQTRLGLMAIAGLKVFFILKR